MNLAKGTFSTCFYLVLDSNILRLEDETARKVTAFTIIYQQLLLKIN